MQKLLCDATLISQHAFCKTSAISCDFKVWLCHHPRLPGNKAEEPSRRRVALCIMFHVVSTCETLNNNGQPPRCETPLAYTLKHCSRQVLKVSRMKCGSSRQNEVKQAGPTRSVRLATMTQREKPVKIHNETTPVTPKVVR